MWNNRKIVPKGEHFGRELICGIKDDTNGFVFTNIVNFLLPQLDLDFENYNFTHTRLRAFTTQQACKRQMWPLKQFGQLPCFRNL